jgi:hypothetical protein
MSFKISPINNAEVRRRSNVKYISEVANGKYVRPRFKGIGLDIFEPFEIKRIDNVMNYLNIEKVA